MSMISEIISIKENQKTIDDLLLAGEVKLSNRPLNNKWILDVLYQNEDCSIGFASCNGVDAGSFPDHVHKESKEYLIVLSGEMILNVSGKPVRELKEGDCASILPGAVHSSIPTKPNTKLAYICVPCDKSIWSVLKKLNRGD